MRWVGLIAGRKVRWHYRNDSHIKPLTSLKAPGRFLRAIDMPSKPNVMQVVLSPQLPFKLAICILEKGSESMFHSLGVVSDGLEELKVG